MAVDSDRIIVIDDKVTYRSFTHVVLKAVSVVFLLFLTFAGLAWGLTIPPVQEKLNSIDVWASSPANQFILLITGFFFIGVVALTYFLYWVYKMFSK